MKITLTKKMTLVFAFSSIIMIGMFFLVTKLIIDNTFESYIYDNQERRNQEIVSYLESTTTLSHDVLMALSHNAMTEGYYLTLRDTNEEVIWTSHNHSSRMMPHSHSQRHTSTSSDHYVESTYSIYQNNNLIGYVDIGQYGSLLLSDSDIKFKNTLFTGLGIVAILGLVLAIFIGYFIAKQLTKPIITINDTANLLERDLSSRVSIRSNTFEIDKLASTINHLASTLEQQELLRKRLTSDISHELRTPLNVLQNQIEALLDHIWEPTPDKLKICYEEVVRLTRLVENLDKLTDLDAHISSLNKKTLSLNELIQTVMIQFETMYLEKKIFLKFESDENVLINGDKDKLKQVIINLLKNAYHYTSENDFVKVSVENASHHVIIIVEDSGCGIKKEDIPFVFERFYRGDSSRNKATGGSGLGLSIVKEIINAHNGTIRVESTEGQGSKFIISLPK
ncbi:signal transduction histidine kinase [Natranaerovirga hydrolytica]|uniref:histidine kinase n=1 Tax=Natranaerovirga hydrolytica TaxID=680378 RepID=A0A4V2Q080_9FIRM|nr:ATP-binding protein [Natranaerovirga hydrolytica]TCK92721.1 signal transduction histidine kinase [Natranaerovirga hydrolytica]